MTWILGLWPDLDLTGDLKIQISSAQLKRLVTSFRLPPRPSRCGYWFSSYQLGAFNALPQARGVWRNIPATSGLKSWSKNINCGVRILIAIDLKRHECVFFFSRDRCNLKKRLDLCSCAHKMTVIWYIFTKMVTFIVNKVTIEDAKFHASTYRHLHPTYVGSSERFFSSGYLIYLTLLC